jgi:putative CocE/NonD family hydrolase
VPTSEAAGSGKDEFEAAIRRTSSDETQKRVSMANSNENGGRYDVQVTAGIRVAMRDGVELNVRITRPDTPGKFPAVLEYNPYRRLSATLAGSRDGYPLVVRYLAERGYVVVQYDVRGTGSSAGFCTDMYSQDERLDGYEMVEWCAAQAWCTGSVGMIGKSYGAVVQWQVAAQNPPHLKAIVVRSGGVDLAPEFSNPGGCIRPWMFEYYAPMMATYNFAPPDAELVGERWEQIWQERLKHSEPWGLSFIRNRDQGAYWGSRSVAPGYDRIRCAVLLIEGWADWYASAELRAFQRLQSPRKVIIGPWGHYYPEERDAFPGPRIDARREYLRWFDHFLKDIENGVVAEPPVSIFVRGWQPPSLFSAEETGAWRSETTWPPENVRHEPVYFGNDGRLAEAPEEGKEVFAHRPSVGVTTGRLGLGSTRPGACPSTSVSTTSTQFSTIPNRSRTVPMSCSASRKSHCMSPPPPRSPISPFASAKWRPTALRALSPRADRWLVGATAPTKTSRLFRIK